MRRLNEGNFPIISVLTSQTNVNLTREDFNSASDTVHKSTCLQKLLTYKYIKFSVQKLT